MKRGVGLRAVTAMGIISFLAGCFAGESGAPDNVAVAPHIFNARAIAFSPDGLVVVTNTGGGWDFMRLPSGKIEKTIAGTGRGSGYGKFSADGQFLAFASHNTVRLWRVADGQRLLDVAVNDARSAQFAPRFVHVAVSPDGNYVAASASIDVNLFVWRVRDEKLIAVLKDEPYRALGWASDGVLSTGALFRLENEHPKAVSPFNKALYNLQPWQISPSPDGELFALESADGLDILNLRSGARHALKFSHSGLTDVRFSPDKSLIALRMQTGDSVRGPHIRSFVEVRRVADGALLHSMQVGTSQNGTDTMGTDMNISGDNRWLVIESREGTLHCWDMNGWRAPLSSPATS